MVCPWLKKLMKLMTHWKIIWKESVAIARYRCFSRMAGSPTKAPTAAPTPPANSSISGQACVTSGCESPSTRHAEATV